MILKKAKSEINIFCHHRDYEKRLKTKNQKPDSFWLESGLTAIWVCNTDGRLLLFSQFPAITAGDIGNAQEQA